VVAGLRRIVQSPVLAVEDIQSLGVDTCRVVLVAPVQWLVDTVAASEVVVVAGLRRILVVAEIQFVAASMRKVDLAGMMLALEVEQHRDWVVRWRLHSGSMRAVEGRKVWIHT